jgi:hypothetical protein
MNIEMPVNHVALLKEDHGHMEIMMANQKDILPVNHVVL